MRGRPSTTMGRGMKEESIISRRKINTIMWKQWNHLRVDKIVRDHAEMLAPKIDEFLDWI